MRAGCFDQTRFIKMAQDRERPVAYDRHMLAQDTEAGLLSQRFQSLCRTGMGLMTGCK